MHEFESDQEVYEFMKEAVGEGGVDPDCIAKIRERYEDARCEGLDPTVALDKATYTHENFDHGKWCPEDENFIHQDKFPKTDQELVEQICKVAADSATERMPADVVEKVMLDNYWRLRDYGCTLAYAYFEGETLAEQELREMFPMLKEEAIFKINQESQGIPLVTKEMLRKFEEFLEMGASVEEAFEIIMKAVALARMLRASFGDSPQEGV